MIDWDEEWKSIQEMTEEELDAELRRDGIDPVGVAPRIAFRACESLGDRAPASLRALAAQFTGWVTVAGEG